MLVIMRMIIRNSRSNFSSGEEFSDDSPFESSPPQKVRRKKLSTSKKRLRRHHISSDDGDSEGLRPRRAVGDSGNSRINYRDISSEEGVTINNS